MLPLQNVSIQNNKIIAKQNVLRPGIFKIFEVLPYTDYKISLSNYDRGDSYQIIFISNLNNKVIYSSHLKHNNIIFNSNNNYQVKISIIFILPQINNYFYLDDIQIQKTNKKKSFPLNYQSEIQTSTKINENNNEIIMNNCDKPIREIIPVHQKYNEKNNKNTLKNNENFISDDDIPIMIIKPINNKRHQINNEINKDKRINIQMIVQKDLPISKIESNNSESKKINIKKEINKNNISVVIPCLFIHLKFIENLLNEYKEQTLLPYEIILVIAESDVMEKDHKNIVQKLKTNKYPFNLNIVEIKGKSLSGNTRYVGIQNTDENTEIIIFQDADDIPHRQRIEIIKYLFDKHSNIVHICHKWSKDFDHYNKNKLYNLKNIKYEIPKFNIFSDKLYRQRQHITNGNIAIKKNIYDKILWFKNKFRQQDISTNINIYNKFKKTIYIKEELYLYRCFNSTFKYNNARKNKLIV